MIRDFIAATLAIIVLTGCGTTKPPTTAPKPTTPPATTTSTIPPTIDNIAKAIGQQHPGYTGRELRRYAARAIELCADIVTYGHANALTTEKLIIDMGAEMDNLTRGELAERYAITRTGIAVGCPVWLTDWDNTIAP